MKRIVLLALAFLLSAAIALGESYEIGNPEDMNVHYACVDFEGEMPENVKAIFAPRLQEGDAILCGTKVEQSYYTLPDLDGGASALLAVERAGRVLILGACRTDGKWTTAIETDSFVPAGTALRMTILPNYLYSGALSGAQPAIVVGEDAYRVTVREDGAVQVSSLTCGMEDGRRMVIDLMVGRIACEAVGEGGGDVLYSGYGVTPLRLGAWTAADFPHNETEAEFVHINNAFVLKEGEAFIAGVNLREKPTGQSKSWGLYSARVWVLGSEKGLQAPWYNVQVGHTTGWVSGDYLVTEADRNRYYSVASMALPVAKAKKAVSLRAEPGAKGGESVAAGTLMHVLCEREDEWLHVIVPRGGIRWPVDWYGTYGFVKKSEVVTGTSIADVTYP